MTRRTSTGSIVAVPGSSDVWRLRVSLGRDPETMRYKVAERVFHGTENKARIALARFVTEKEDGKVSTDRSSVATVMSRYIEHARTGGAAPKTLQGYEHMATWLKGEIGSVPVRKLTGADIDALMARVRAEKGASSADHYYRFLRAAMRQAVRWGLLNKAPTDFATAPSPPTPAVSAPSPESVRGIVELATARAGRIHGDEDLAALIVVAATTGSRRGEMCALTVGDIDLERRAMLKRRSASYVGRTMYLRELKASRPGYRVALDDFFTEGVLRAQLRRVEHRCNLLGISVAPEMFVWSDEPDHSKPIIPDRVTGRWRRLAKRSGLDNRFHDLRHFAATMMLSEGVDPVTVAARLGHSVQVLLARYSHVIEARDQDAAAILGALVAPPAEISPRGT